MKMVGSHSVFVSLYTHGEGLK